MTLEMKMREAYDDGKEESRIEIALEMLKDSVPIDRIIRYTKLPKERIEELIAQEGKQ